MRRILLALMLLAAGCAGPPDQAPGATASSWLPPDRPRAVIVALHGFNDYRAAFAEFGAFAAARGVAVEAYDQPGFGATSERGRWPGTPELVRKLDETVAAARRQHPGLPVFLLGESMGGSVALTAMGRPDPPDVDGVILAAPAVWNGADLPVSYRATLHLLASVMPMLRVNARHVRRQASDNVSMLRALGRDPLYLHYTRIDAVSGLVDLMVESQEVAPKVKAPMLVLLGARDQIVPPAGSRRFVATLDPSTCSVVTYLQGWHLLLRDHQRERTFADILAWIDGKPLPSGLDRPCGPPPPV
ncbi:MAG: alpha/beta fold hydrolase [Geminicoccaceae bacterium]